MKTKLGVLLIAVLNAGLVCFAQNPPEGAQNAPPGTNAAAPPAVVATPEATPIDTNAAPAEVIEFNDAELLGVIKTLARQANINFQFDPKVTAAVGPDGQPRPQPNVSIRFEGVTAQQALEAVLNNYSLQMVPDERTKTARITVKDPAAPEPLVTKIFQLRFSNPSNMVVVLKPTLRDPRGQVIADPRTSQLIVVATEREMDSIDTLLTTLDLPPRQVLIEARLLETSRNPTSIKGIDWTGTLQAQKITFGNGFSAGNTVTTIPGGTTTTTTPGGRVLTSTERSTSATTLNTAVGNGGFSANTALGVFPNIGFLRSDGVSAVLSFLNTDNDTEVLSTPRTVTLDNEKAKLSVTRAFPIFKVTPGTQLSPAGAEITYTNLGTILEVTPRIAANNNIALTIVPEVSNIDSVDRQTINGEVNTANIYAIRRMETHVLIPSGSTLVMGGLLSDSSSKGYTKVPLLGDLPGLGHAFRKDSKTRNKSNLIIFITPTIVEDSDFQPTESDFLKTQMVEKPEPKDSLWNSGKPHDWRKPVY